MRTETKNKTKKQKRNDKIVLLWASFYEDGKAQKTALAESIAKKVGCSISTVQRIVKANN